MTGTTNYLVPDCFFRSKITDSIIFFLKKMDQHINVVNALMDLVDDNLVSSL
jgi:hypothetical protein